MGLFKDWRDTLASATSKKTPIYAGLAFLVVTVVGSFWPEVRAALVGVIDFPSLGDKRVTIFGVPALAFGIAAVGVGFGLWMLECATAHRKKLLPTLSVSYDDARPDCHKFVRESNDRGKTLREARSLRLRVEAISGVNVEGCTGHLTRIEYRAPGGSFSDVTLHEPAQLHWTTEANEFAAVTVSPRVPKYLGICSVRPADNGVRLRTRFRSFVTPDLLEDEGEYRFHIEVVADRCAPVAALVLVAWNGNWSETKAWLVKDNY